MMLAQVAGDALMEAIATSGPATGAVLLAAWMLRTWMSDLKASMAGVLAKIDALMKNDSDAREAITELRIKLATLAERVDKIERR